MFNLVSRFVGVVLLFVLCAQPAFAAYVDIVVVGSTGPGTRAWGTDTYTSDSKANVAAVHAGLVNAGDAAVVRKTFTAGQDTYTGSTRNGVTTEDYTAWGSSYTLSLVSALDSYTPPVASWADVSGGSFGAVDSMAVSSDGAVMVVVSGGEVWVSSNTGTTWTNVAGVGSAINGLSFGSAQVSQDGSRIAIIGDSNLWVTADNGSTWTNVSDGEPFSGGVADFAISEDGDVIALHMSLEADFFTYVSTDGGDTWTRIDEGTTVENKEQLSLFFISSDAQTILAKDGGAATTTWRTTDGGATWDDALDSVSHGAVTEYTTQSVSADGQTILLYGTEDTGLFTTLLSVDGGDTWTDVATTTAIAGYEILNVSVSSNGARLAVKAFEGIFVSTDNGATWFNVTQGTDTTNYAIDDFEIYETTSGQVGILAEFNSLVQKATIATPSVSSVSVTPSTSSASISWTSNIYASSKASFGTSDAYGSATAEADTTTRVTSHTATLSGLTACTTYHYAVTSRTILGAAATSTDATFTTAGCTEENEEETPRSSGGSNWQYVGVPVFTAPTAGVPVGGITPSQTQAILDLLASFGADAEVVRQVAATLGAAPQSTTTFTRDLQLNDTGADVRALQAYLNTHGYPLAATGLGSLGQETDRFGALTYYALIKFQLAHGLPGTGYFGPMTRKVINAR